MNKGNRASKSGFTLIEIIVFMGIFSAMALVFLTILVVVSRIHVRESASAEVNQQSSYLLRTIEASVQGASLVELDADVSTTTLKLRMASSSIDPTYIYLSSAHVYIKEGNSGIPQQISSDRVDVTTLNFTKRQNPGAKDTVALGMSVSYHTSNLQQAFTQALSSGVSKVSAAVFDSNIVPNTGDTYKLGAAAGDWRSVNDTIYFSGSNVGIGTETPEQVLEVNGGLRLNPQDDITKPDCDATSRGTLWFTVVKGGPDLLEVCMFDTDYLWRQINESR
jgi:type II secretory pathway pseudopilin PulG